MIDINDREYPASELFFQIKYPVVIFILAHNW